MAGSAYTYGYVVLGELVGLLPRWFAKTDPVRHVPVRITWIVGVASAVIAGCCRSPRRPS